MDAVVSSDTVMTSSPSLWSRFHRLWARRETVRYLTSSNLKAGHRDKVLGHLWNLLDPLMFMLVYYFVFGILFNQVGGQRSADYMLYLFIGLLAWNFISGSIQQATLCIRSNRGLILEINFPKTVFPVSVALARLYDYVWGIVILFVFLIAAGVWPTWHVLWLPVLIIIALLFTTGVSMIVAYLGAFFADTSNVVNVALRLMFYCSPLFYYVRDVTKTVVENGVSKEIVVHHALIHNPLYWNIYMSNPVACMFECLRDVLLWGREPDPRLLAYAATVSVVIFLAGFAIFSKNEGKFAKYI